MSGPVCFAAVTMETEFSLWPRWLCGGTDVGRCVHQQDVPRREPGPPQGRTEGVPSNQSLTSALHPLLNLFSRKAEIEMKRKQEEEARKKREEEEKRIQVRDRSSDLRRLSL